MKTIVLFCAIIIVLIPQGAGADPAIFLNAFGETATAYLNDSYLLLGTIADGFVADIIEKEWTNKVAANIQKRIRIVRGKLKTVARCKIADVDKKLIQLLDDAYACMDHQAWALTQYVQEKSPETARRFVEQRTECLGRLEKVRDFYSKLPHSPGLAEPLSTR